MQCKYSHGAECDGCGSCSQDEEPVLCCPICGEDLMETDLLYINSGGIIGCEFCTDKTSAGRYRKENDLCQ